jgi:hypothetical protein
MEFSLFNSLDSWTGNVGIGNNSGGNKLSPLLKPGARVSSAADSPWRALVYACLNSSSPKPRRSSRSGTQPTHPTRRSHPAHLLTAALQTTRQPTHPRQLGFTLAQSVLKLAQRIVNSLNLRDSSRLSTSGLSRLAVVKIVSASRRT